MPELVCPGSSPEMVAAAVRNGADAVYMGFGILGASDHKRGMTVTEFAKSAEFCRVRGVNVYGLMNIFAVDGEYEKLYETAMYYNHLGANALIAQDLGVIRFLRQILPDMPIFGGQKLGVHDVQGVKLCAAMGLRRLSLPSELTGKEISRLAMENAMELEVTVHGPMCMAFPGECHMNALIRKNPSGVTENCGEICRTELVYDGMTDIHPLALKDICLADKLGEMLKSGVSAFRIGGYSRDPEYVAMVTGIYSRVIHDGKAPDNDEMAVLQEAYSRGGFTDGFYNSPNGQGQDMLGGGIKGTKVDPKYFSAMRKYYINHEQQRIPLKFVGRIRHGEPAKLMAFDVEKNVVAVEGDVPNPAFYKSLTNTTLQTQLCKLSGTPFYFDGLESSIEDGLTISNKCISRMLSEITEKLKEKRKVHTPVEQRSYPYIDQTPNDKIPPILTMSVTKASQLANIDVSFSSVIYVPVEEILEHGDIIEPFLRNSYVDVVAILPKVVRDSTRPKLERQLNDIWRMGISCLQVESLSQIRLAQRLGFKARGGLGLAAYNSRTLSVLSGFGLESVLLPFELNYSIIDGMAKELPTELMVYGRMPLMTTECCVVKNRSGICACNSVSGLKDKNGMGYPVIKEPDCGNKIYGAKKLFLADKSGDYSQIGLWGVRLAFTTENSMECAAIVQRYLKKGGYRPQAATRGLYYKRWENWDN